MKSTFLAGIGILALSLLGNSALAAESYPSANNPSDSVPSMIIECLDSNLRAVPITSGKCAGTMPGNSGLGYKLTMVGGVDGVNAAGGTTPVTGISNGSYIWNCTASNWNSATALLQTLGADGTTWMSGLGATAMSANGSQGVVVGANASARILVTGTPTALKCNLT